MKLLSRLFTRFLNKDSQGLIRFFAIFSILVFCKISNLSVYAQDFSENNFEEPFDLAQNQDDTDLSNSVNSIGSVKTSEINSNKDILDNSNKSAKSISLPKKNNNKRMWNLDDVDLLALIGEMSRVTGRNFVIDSRVTGKASLISNKPMNDEEAYQAFLSILQVQGFTVIDAGRVTKIVPDSVARQIDSKVNSDNLKALGEEMVVQVISVKNVSATALLPILRGLVNQQVAHLAAYAPSNVIVIADHAANVARITEIIKRIDKQNTDDVEIITLKDASSDEIVKVLSNLMANSQQLGDLGTQQIKMAADVRTNSILLSGDKSKRLKIRALIAQMDVPTPRTGDTEVIRLNYQTADALVPVISGIVEAYWGKAGNNSYDSNASRSRSSGDPGAAGLYKSNSTNLINNSNSPNNNNSGLNMASTLQLPDARREGGASGPGVRAEPNTNALVVTAPPELMKNIKAVIAELDVRRYQVLVEALIVEVTMQRTQDLGIEWRLNHNNNSGLRGGTNFGSGDSTTGFINGAIANINAKNVAAGVAPNLLTTLPLSGLTLGFMHGSDLKAVLYALQKDNNTNIVSTPSLVAMDNETAEIVVADKIPVKTGDSVSTTSADAPIRSTFDYRSVGLTLKLTPMITKGDAVKLTIEQTQGSIKDLGANGDTPTTSERSIKTAVVVNNQDILVLGGLIQDQQGASESKIPFLGDIPLIGEMFKRGGDSLTKKNLMVFIRPVVLRNNEESNNVSLSKYDYTRDGQLLYKLDPYAKIAQELIMELPEKNNNNNKNKDNKKLKLPEPFNTDLTIAGLTF